MPEQGQQPPGSAAVVEPDTLAGALELERDYWEQLEREEREKQREPVSHLRSRLAELLTATRARSMHAQWARGITTGLTLASCLVITATIADGMSSGFRLIDSLGYSASSQWMVPGHRPALIQGLSCYGWAVCGVGLLASWALLRLASLTRDRNKLRLFWQQRLRDGAFLPLLLDEELGQLLLARHHELLAGAASLKSLPGDALGRLRAIAAHAEALARTNGHVEQLGRRDLRLANPFGADPWWGVLSVALGLWALVGTYSLCTGRLFTFGGSSDPFFSLIALLLQLGPLAAVEFSRVCSRVNVGLEALLEQLTS